MSEEWPLESLPLAAAIWRLLDKEALKQEVANLAPGAGFFLANERFKAVMTEGKHRSEGSRGSPTTPVTSIPSQAWSCFDLLDRAASIVYVDDHRTGAAWFNVHIMPPLMPPVPVPKFGSLQECRNWAFANIPRRRGETIAAWLERIAGFGREHGYELTSLRQRWSDYCKLEQESKRP
jgi:hypothetical protein